MCTKKVHGGGGTSFLGKNQGPPNPILSEFAPTSQSKNAPLPSSESSQNAPHATTTQKSLTPQNVASSSTPQAAPDTDSVALDLSGAASSADASLAGVAHDALALSGVDLGFRVFRVDESSFVDNHYGLEAYGSDGVLSQGNLGLELEESVKPDSKPLDLLFECVLLWHLPLHCPYSEEELSGYAIYSYNHGDLMACFASEVGEDLVFALAAHEPTPLRFVLCDSSFRGSAAKINFCELFKTLLPEVELRVI